MATMTAVWNDATTGTLTILDGPATGTYPFSAFSAVEAGILNLGPHHLGTPGRIVQLKIDLAKNLPHLSAEIGTRKATALAATRAADTKHAAQNAVDQQMARAGFSTGSAVLDTEYGYKAD